MGHNLSFSSRRKSHDLADGIPCGRAIKVEGAKGCVCCFNQNEACLRSRHLILIPKTVALFYTPPTPHYQRSPIAIACGQGIYFIGTQRRRLKQEVLKQGGPPKCHLRARLSPQSAESFGGQGRAAIKFRRSQDKSNFEKSRRPALRSVDVFLVGCGALP